MSFTSILQKIGQVGQVIAGIEHTAAPWLALIPGAAPIVATVDAIVARVQATIATVEANNPVEGQGKIKADATIADFQAGLELTQQLLRTQGKTLTYDQGELQAGINAQVEAYNHFAALKASFKTVDLPKPAQGAK